MNQTLHKKQLGLINQSPTLEQKKGGLINHTPASYPPSFFMISMVTMVMITIFSFQWKMSFIGLKKH